MNPILKNILAVVLGIAVGGLINMGIIIISGSLIAPPEGAITTTTEGLQESMHLFEPKHFIMPFLAHALGTLFGALLAALIASTHKMKFPIAIGCFFLLGGIMSVFMLPSPIWFTILDLVGAYLPMAYIGGKLALMILQKQA